jgi:large subunit ribosomal protein L25
MSMVDEPVKLKEREVLGKGLSSIRGDGFVPAVVHNHGEVSLHVMASEVELVKVYREAGKHHPLELQVGSKRFLALIKDVQFNPVKHRMQHVVFQAIRRDEKVEAEIPVHLDGDAPAEKIGLMVLHQLDHVEVEALPQNLPDELRVDACMLAELHDKITVADIKAPEGVTILTELDHPIASVVETKAQMAEEAEEGVGGEEVEGQAAEGAEAEAAGTQAADKPGE